MRVTESMLRDLVSTTLSVEELADTLTMLGFEVEGVERISGEVVLDVGITSNRGDGASALGLAREILAKHASAKPTELFERLAARYSLGDDSERGAGELASIEIHTEACARFACRVFEDVAHGGTPGWIASRLTATGHRPISLLVDLTNYVMLELGQPMHAYDMDTLAAGPIMARQAADGERVVTLDEEERELTARDMVIADSSRAVGIAGVMGGLETEVTDSTTRCLLESAHFAPSSVRRTRNSQGMHTDASYRFERWVDPDGAVMALNRFADLYSQATGRRCASGVVDVYPSPRERRPIRLRSSRLDTLLGIEVPMGTAAEYLERLGFEVSASGESLTAEPPSWRPDVEIEDDLVEEVGRIHGYEHIPELLPQGTTEQGGTRGPERMTDVVHNAAIACGFVEIISHSLRDEHPLDAPGDRVVVRNPSSPEAALLRNSSLPCLAEALVRNGATDFHCFELGRVFAPSNERKTIALLSVGRIGAEGWHGEGGGGADFFTLKGVVERLIAATGRRCSIVPNQQPDPRLHLHRQAAIGGIGVIGQVHPTVAKGAKIPERAVLAELDLAGLFELPEVPPSADPISRNPAVRRDIALVVADATPYAKLSQAVLDSAGEVLESHWLVSEYRGEGVPVGKRSLAIALQLRAQDENLTDEQANQVRDRVVAALESLGARLRGP